MFKTITAIVLVTIVAAGTIDTASAFPNKAVLDALINSLKLKKSHHEEVGVTFDARAAFADPKADCEDAGGIALRKFNDEGIMEWTCTL